MAITGTAPPRRKRAGAGSSMSRRILLYAVPALLVYAMIVLVPTIQGSVYAFTDWNGLNRGYSFVGFDNLAKVLADPKSMRALINTLVIAFTFTIVQNVLGLLLALAVNSQIKLRNLLKVIIFAPAVMTPVVVGYLWRYMLAPDGPVNSVLRALGLDSLAKTWLGDPGLALGAIIFVLIWQLAGYSMVIFLAGLQGVPEEILEAAAVDGAGPIRRFFNVVLPSLGPAITINLMLSMIGSLKLFDHVWALTGGGPGGLTNTLTTLMFREAFEYGSFGRSVALGLILLVIVLLISIVQYRVLLKRELR